MSKASSRRKRTPLKLKSPFLSSFLVWRVDGLSQDVTKAMVHPRYRPLWLYFSGSVLVSVMWAWNWKLVLATGTGIGGMSLVYLLPQYQEQWQQWRLLFEGFSGKMTLAVGVGGTVAFSTYLMTAIWAESDNHWLAVGSLLQGMGTAVTLGLVIWQVAIANQNRDTHRWETWLSDLTATQAIKRLIAVRQLTALVEQEKLSEGQFQQLVEYFSLMLTQETEITVRDALFNSLQTWKVSVTKPEQLKPLQIPVSRPSLQVYRPISLD